MNKIKEGLYNGSFFFAFFTVINMRRLNNILEVDNMKFYKTFWHMGCIFVNVILLCLLCGVCILFVPITPHKFRNYENTVIDKLLDNADKHYIKISGYSYLEDVLR